VAISWCRSSLALVGSTPRRGSLYLNSRDEARRKYAIAPINPVAGSVITHAKIISPATSQRADDPLRAKPTPVIEPAIVCVVEIGVPSQIAMKTASVIRRGGRAAAGIGSNAVQTIKKGRSGWGSRSAPSETPLRRRFRYSPQGIAAVSSRGLVRRRFTG
jgi:hypothetical protein